MRKTLLIVLPIYMFLGFTEKKANHGNNFIIGNGQMPNLVKDRDNIFHLVFGTGDSIMYSYSSDQAMSFSPPSLIAVLPKLAASHTRGPQVAASNKGITVIACNSLGDIFSYFKAGTESWLQTSRVNDMDTVAKENLIALSADGENAFAVWLDVRANRQNKIYGAKSMDGGKTWAKNRMIYISPDTTVCECCKPSVIVYGKNIYVMFRNWMKGNRDMYLIQSQDGGNTFGEAKKLGNGNWKLNGCPMDGGALTINKKGEIQTAWRREGKVYSAIPGMPEIEIGTGKGCAVETIDEKNIYAWTEKGQVMVVTSTGQRKVIGKGSQVVIKATDNKQVICVWEFEKQIHASLVQL